MIFFKNELLEHLFMHFDAFIQQDHFQMKHLLRKCANSLHVDLWPDITEFCENSHNLQTTNYTMGSPTCVKMMCHWDRLDEEVPVGRRSGGMDGSEVQETSVSVPCVM